MPLTELVLVDSPGALDRALSLLDDLDVVGVDVERADWDRYYRAAATIQVGGRGRVAVVDPLALTDLSALDAFLAGRTTVFHALENDLEPIVTVGVRPDTMADTAVAAAVLGLPTGLEVLLRDLLGVELSGDKAAMQRANWEARPLTPQMLAYAAGDVADLPALWTALERRLTATDRRHWYDQELAATLAQPPVEQRREWTRTRGAGRLDAAARARLRALWNAREDLGRSTDTAPGRIAGDAVLVDLATTPPRGVAELGRRGVRRQAARLFGHRLLAAIAEGDAAPPEPRSASRAGRAPTDADRAMIERLRQLRSIRAKALGIDAGVLCPSRTLGGAVLADPATPAALRDALGLRPWQWEQLGATFCEALRLEGPGKPPAVTDPPPLGTPDTEPFDLDPPAGAAGADRDDKDRDDG